MQVTIADLAASASGRYCVYRMARMTTGCRMCNFHTQEGLLADVSAHRWYV